MTTDSADPGIQSSQPTASANGEAYTALPFPLLYRSHVRHCAFDWWHSRYRSLTPKARLIPLTPPFVDYLRSDGIVLPADPTDILDSDSGIFSSSDAERANGEAEDDDEEPDVSEPWTEVHEAITATIAELGGAVVPKLNWSAPKDATWISATNSLECRTANDIYLLLKSSDFITHDLTCAFDGTIDDDDDKAPTKADRADKDNDRAAFSGSQTETAFHLVLRKYFQLNPSLEFRCFVRNRKLLGISQRDLNHFDFLQPLRPKLSSLISEFFDKHVKNTFPDDNFTFDVYIPPPHGRVWLVDFNPWDRRTDPLLFSWLELLTLPEPIEQVEEEEEVIRIPIQIREHDTTNTNGPRGPPSSTDADDSKHDENSGDDSDANDANDEDDEDEENDQPIPLSLLPTTPIFRIVSKSDPEAYMFNTPKYSAHKMPRDVVDAATAATTAGINNLDLNNNADPAGKTEAQEEATGGLREFAATWKELLDRERGRVVEDSSDDEQG